MRYYVARQNSRIVSDSVEKWLSREKKLNIHRLKGYISFKKRVDQITFDFKKLLKTMAQQKKRVAGYAATSKSTTFLNYAHIGPDLIEYITDTTPSKIGLLTPGTHVPIKSHEYFIKDDPPYTVLFAYNHKKEVFEKEKLYRKRGGKFIIYFPKVVIS